MSERLKARHAAAAALQQAASLGYATANPVAATGAAPSPVGFVRLTVASSANLPGLVVVSGVEGTTEANGSWEIAIVDATHVDLYGSAYANDYTGGGTVAGNFPDFVPLVGAKLGLTPTWPSQFGKPSAASPQLLLYALAEKNKTRAEAGTNPQFETTLTLVIEARIEIAVKEASVALPSETAPADPLGDALDTLCSAVKRALLTSAAFVSMFEHIGDCETALKPDGTGARQIDNAYVALDVVYGEEFEPVIVERLGGFNIWVDALNVFDPSGTYAPPFAYTPTKAPRSAGPDGRPEIGLSVTVGPEEILVWTNGVSPFTVAADVNAVFVNGATALIYLPENPTLEQIVTVKDGAGVALANGLKVETQDGSTIDGQASFDFTANFQAATFQWNGNGWSVL